MSDTPARDAYKLDLLLTVDQRDEAREIAKKYEDRYFNTKAERDQLRAQLTELQAGKERLRKLAAELYTAARLLMTAQEEEHEDRHFECGQACDALRAAIDAARKEQA